MVNKGPSFLEMLFALVLATASCIPASQRFRDLRQVSKQPNYSETQERLDEFKGGGLGIDGLLMYVLSKKDAITEEDFGYLSKTHYFERSKKFVPVEGEKSKFSALRTVLTGIDNMKLIKKVDDTPVEKLDDGLKPLKELVDKLNVHYEDKELTQTQRLRRMYNDISEYTPREELTDGAIGIKELVNGRKGDCNDFAAAYYAFFNYYRIRTDFRFGKNANTGVLHAYLKVDAGDWHVDMDPLWYERFAPLEIRHWEVETFVLKDEYFVLKEAN